MTAGHGVLHSELPHQDETAHTLQLWLNLPGRQKMIPARYVNQDAASVPMVTGPGTKVRLYAGKVGDVVVPPGSDWPMSLMEVEAEAGATVALDVPAGDRGFLYLLSGDAIVGAGAAHVEAGEAAWFEPSDAAGFDTLTVTAGAPLRALLYSGTPIDEPVVARGPFVMTSDAEIAAAYEDYRTGRFLA
jgi:hypothetical protein